MIQLGRRRWASVLAFLAVMGPGIITGFAGNDAGGVTTYSAVGAHYGFALLWLLLVSTVGLVVVQEMCARMGAVTGKGLSDLIRENFGVRWTMLAMLALLVANGSNVVAEFAGIAASLELLSIPRVVSVPIAAAVIWAVVVFFDYKTVERTLFVLVLAFVAYPVTALIVHPDWAAVARSFVVPNIPAEQAALVAALALVGTTITPYMQFYLQASIVDKGIDIEAYPLERVDVVLGAILTGLNGFFIVVVTGQVLYPAHVVVDTAEQAAMAFGPLVGTNATLLFGVGLFAASALAALVLPLSTAYAVTEAFGWESGISKRFGEAPIFMGLFTFLILAGAAVVALTKLPLIPLIVLSQDVQGLLLPVVLFFIVRLAGDRVVMKQHANGAITRTLGVAVAVLASVLSLALVAVSVLSI
jgi:Mn2+/Fe2+ NRAMP family transporter